MKVITDDIVVVENLKMYFSIVKGVFKKKVAGTKAVDNVSFKIKRGETLGLAGESGCGKSTVGRCVLRVYEPTEGHIYFEGQDISMLTEKKVAPLRRQMQLVFQDPYSSLNPRQSARSIVGEPLWIHSLVRTKAEFLDRVEELFRVVGLNPCMMDRYPHEFSGGQRQRIGIARALACEPSFIVCDEPISALDVSIQAQIVNLLQELQEKLGLTYLFIAHDLSVVKHISKRVAIMYLGKIVETTDAEALYENPLHPYTKALLSAIPIPDPFIEEERKRIILKGDVPSSINQHHGCVFHTRCPMSTSECTEVDPSLKDVGDSHYVACIYQ